MDNKFLAWNDIAFKTIGDFEIPLTWWSRPYEYAFADQYINKKLTVVDAGCGIEHPFKYHLAANSKHCTAMDRDERLRDLPKADNLQFCVCDITNPVNSETPISADTVFCISVLEHLHPDQQAQAIKNFASWLKPKGKLVMTIDYPTAKPENVLAMLEPYFEIGKTNYEPDNKANIVMQGYNLKVFTVVGVKKKVVIDETNTVDSVDDLDTRCHGDKKLSKG